MVCIGVLLVTGFLYIYIPQHSACLSKKALTGTCGVSLGTSEWQNYLFVGKQKENRRQKNMTEIYQEHWSIGIILV